MAPYNPAVPSQGYGSLGPLHYVLQALRRCPRSGRRDDEQEEVLEQVEGEEEEEEGKSRRRRRRRTRWRWCKYWHPVLIWEDRVGHFSASNVR